MTSKNNRAKCHLGLGCGGTRHSRKPYRSRYKIMEESVFVS